jgi:hypothetical protein
MALCTHNVKFLYFIRHTQGLKSGMECYFGCQPGSLGRQRWCMFGVFAAIAILLAIPRSIVSARCLYTTHSGEEGMVVHIKGACSPSACFLVLVYLVCCYICCGPCVPSPHPPRPVLLIPAGATAATVSLRTHRRILSMSGRRQSHHALQ